MSRHKRKQKGKNDCGFCLNETCCKTTNLLSYNNLRHYHRNNYFYHRKHSDDQYTDHHGMETWSNHNLLAL